jgi:hypothetical protein
MLESTIPDFMIADEVAITQLASFSEPSDVVRPAHQILALPLSISLLLFRLIANLHCWNEAVSSSEDQGRFLRHITHLYKTKIQDKEACVCTALPRVRARSLSLSLCVSACVCVLICLYRKTHTSAKTGTTQVSYSYITENLLCLIENVTAMFPTTNEEISLWFDFLEQFFESIGNSNRFTRQLKLSRSAAASGSFSSPPRSTSAGRSKKATVKKKHAPNEMHVQSDGGLTKSADSSRTLRSRDAKRDTKPPATLTVAPSASPTSVPTTRSRARTGQGDTEWETFCHSGYLSPELAGKRALAAKSHAADPDAVCDTSRVRE